MPYQYVFVKPDGELANLDDIDRELCKRTNYPFSKTNFCPMFVLLSQWLSLAVLMKSGGSYVTKDALDAYFSLPDNDTPPETKELAYEFLCERYTLDMRYSRYK